MSPSLAAKLEQLSPELRARIRVEHRQASPRDGVITKWLIGHKRHCNGGRTVDAGLWLREHCHNGGKLFITMSGAGSSFEMGITLSELIRAGVVAAISVTGANLEESLYRLVAHDDYVNIPEFEKLRPEWEKELDRAGLRRITDTFLPEDESVRMILPLLEKLWREAGQTGESFLWHEYFFELFERGMIAGNFNFEDCWLYQAWKHGVAIVVGGPEDSTMGNIFAYYCYGGNHRLLADCKQKEPINSGVVKPAWAYMHTLAEWYLEQTQEKGLAFVQLGGGIAADFPICVVPHLKKDFLFDQSIEVQEKLVRSWAGFVEIYSSPMSFGSYSGAGGDEKITWGKLEPDSYRVQICGDYTEHFPDIAAIILGM